jgi:carboxyl-terminal processing protease
MINHPLYRLAIRHPLLSAARYASVVVASLLFALPTTAQESADPLPLPLNEVRMFTQALDHIRRAYVEEIDDETLLEYSIHALGPRPTFCVYGG